jgi:hypothetical protein
VRLIAYLALHKKAVIEEVFVPVELGGAQMPLVNHEKGREPE